MKKWIFIFFFISFFGIKSGFSHEIDENCSLNGIPLYGRVKVVSSHADFKVKQVSHFEDLTVKETSTPNSCGEWMFVDVKPDFTIKYVSSFEDFSINFGHFGSVN